MVFQFEAERQAIGREISDCRHEVGLTQRQFAEKVGVPHAVVMNWETGRRRFYADEFFRVCDALGWDRDKFMQRIIAAVLESRRKQARPKLTEGN